jgi:hypothetical protein
MSDENVPRSMCKVGIDRIQFLFGDLDFRFAIESNGNEIELLVHVSSRDGR